MNIGLAQAEGGGEQVILCGGSPTALWEGGVSRTGPGVIILIDTSPRTRAHPPQGPIRELALGRGGGDGAGTGAACDCIMGVIALVIFVYPRVAPPTAHSPQTHRAH